MVKTPASLPKALHYADFVGGYKFKIWGYTKVTTKKKEQKANLKFFAMVKVFIPVLATTLLAGHNLTGYLVTFIHYSYTYRKLSKKTRMGFSFRLALQLVPEAGIEPARKQVPRDFKSLVSTSSTTRAGC